MKKTVSWRSSCEQKSIAGSEHLTGVRGADQPAREFDHRMLLHRVSLGHVEANFGDCGVLQRKRNQSPQKRPHIGKNLTALVNAVDYNALPVGIASRLGDAMETRDRR